MALDMNDFSTNQEEKAVVNTGKKCVSVSSAAAVFPVVTSLLI